MLCEICGEREGVTRIELDGVVLWVCSQCAKFGREIKKEVKRERRRVQVTEKAEEDILPDYAIRVRNAREKRNMSREDLARMINERVSVIEKVESGKMIPEDRLVRKLEKALGIKLKGAVDYGQSDSSESPGMTLGDIAQVRVKG